MIRGTVRWNSSSPRLSALSLSIAIALGSPVARAATITVTDDTDPIPTSSTTTCTLRQAIEAINNQGPDAATGNCTASGAFGTSDTIIFKPGLTAINLDGATNGELDIKTSNDLLINGGTSLGQVTVSLASGSYSVIGTRNTNSLSNLTLTGLTITGGNIDGDGGGVFLGRNGNTLTLNNSVVTSNFAAHDGGAAYAYNVVANNSTISNNTAGYVGGGVKAYGVVLNNSLVTGNTAGTVGGGIYAAYVTSNHGTVSYNRASIAGAGVATKYGGTFADSLISGNTLTGPQSEGGSYPVAIGAGIISAQGALSLTNSTISNNTVSNYYGPSACGGIVAGIPSKYQSFNGALTLTNSTISGNNGTAVCAYVAVLTNSTVTGNAGEYASGVYVSSAIGLFNSTVSGNAGPAPAVRVGTPQQAGFLPKPTTAKSGTGHSFAAQRDALLARMQVHGTGHLFTRAQKHAGRTQAAGIHGGNLQAANLSSNLSLYSSIVTENAGVYDIYSRGSTVASGGFNIIGNVSNTISLVSLTNEVSGSPLLGALSGNGCAVPAGETSTAGCVQTMALQPGSPAINTGSTIPSGVTTDERGAGFARPSGAAADIGAFEFVFLPPAAAPLSKFIVFNTPLTFALSGSDANPGGPFTLTYAPGASPSHGTVSINPTSGSTTYTPTTGYSGPDSFTYTVSDVNGTSTAATVTLTVGTPPSAVALVENVSYDTPLTFSLQGTDSNPGGPFTFTFAAVTSPTHGTITVTASTGSTTYTPNNGYTGSDSFTYTVTDANGTSTPATVTLNVAPGVLPIAQPNSASTTENTPVNITLTATDANPGTSPFTFAVGTSPAHGTVTLGAPTTTGLSTPASIGTSHSGTIQFRYGIAAANGTVTATYTPAASYAGADSFTFTASNANGTSAPATVTIAVAAAPVTFTPEPSPALSTWAWGALIAQFGLIAWYRLRRFPDAAPKKKAPSAIE